MKRDQLVGLCVAVGSIIAAILLNLVLHQQEAGLRPEMYILPALGVLIGLLMIFTDFERQVNLQEIIDELPEELGDDIEAIKKGQITFPMVAAALSMVGIIAETWLIFHYRKWNAEWFGVNVLLVSILVAIGTAALCFFLEWFQNRDERLTWKIFIIPTVGFLLCSLLGVFYAEPLHFSRLSAMQKDQLARSSAYYQESRGGQFWYSLGGSTNSGGSSSSSVDFDCDGDACLALALLAVVVICVVSSAFIPHFWLLATMLLLSIMVMVAIRELLYYERRYQYR